MSAVDHSPFEPVARRVIKTGIGDLLPWDRNDRDALLDEEAASLAQALAELADRHVEELRDERAIVKHEEEWSGW